MRLLTSNIDGFKSVKVNSTTIKHVYNESAKITEGCNVAFHTNDYWNIPKTLPLITIESMVTCACLHYTRDYLTQGICHLIKPIAMEKLMPFPTQIHTAML